MQSLQSLSQLSTLIIHRSGNEAGPEPRPSERRPNTAEWGEVEYVGKRAWGQRREWEESGAWNEGRQVRPSVVLTVLRPALAESQLFDAPHDLRHAAHLRARWHPPPPPALSSSHTWRPRTQTQAGPQGDFISSRTSAQQSGAEAQEGAAREEPDLSRHLQPKPTAETHNLGLSTKQTPPSFKRLSEFLHSWLLAPLKPNTCITPTSASSVIQ
ncbi:uncharacterized protein LOC121016656 [Herpailurus yagouaroundi]|uniref:uncharacterized protein LOC121016656 n=1 Tax=Herpailurus yagouaroundi TaxID=1608482 RepID=UPI001AD72297|nr:uncharacterized protein LOC121016656 [Puma yagouaroundi]